MLTCAREIERALEDDLRVLRERELQQLFVERAGLGGGEPF